MEVVLEHVKIIYEQYALSYRTCRAVTLQRYRSVGIVTCLRQEGVGAVCVNFVFLLLLLFKC